MRRYKKILKKLYSLNCEQEFSKILGNFLCKQACKENNLDHGSKIRLIRSFNDMNTSTAFNEKGKCLSSFDEKNDIPRVLSTSSLIHISETVQSHSMISVGINTENEQEVERKNSDIFYIHN